MKFPRTMGRAAMLIAVIATHAFAAPPRNASLPSVSPDGGRIVFCSERDTAAHDLYVIDAAGRHTVRLTHSVEEELVPAWTGDGKSVVYTTMSGDTTTLHRIGLDGTGHRVLVTLAGKSIALSHDGRHIAFTLGTWSRNRLAVSGVDGASVAAISDSSAGYFNLAWSPDDRRIAATRLDSTRALEVWVLNADGSDAHAIARFAAADGRPQWPAWSPDGRQIAVQSGVYDRAHPENSSAFIWVIDVATRAARKLAARERPWLDETPSWFPDGRRIAFQSDRTGRMELWMMRADGTGARQITR